MKIVATADTHGQLPETPECDLFIHAGDWSPLDIQHDTDMMQHWVEDAFVPWLWDVPAKHKIVIAGNHDFVAQEHYLHRLFEDANDGDGDIHYLQDEVVMIDGLTIYGTPYTPEFGPWAFGETETQLAMRYASIPDSTDILVCHGPAYGQLDRTNGGQHVGSVALRNRLQELSATLICGHIHEAAGSIYSGREHNVAYGYPNRRDGLYRPVEIEIHPS